MPRTNPGGLAALAILLAASVAIKLASINAGYRFDEDRLVQDLLAAMRAGGYEATAGSGDWWRRGLVSARKRECRVGLRNATAFGPDFEAVTVRRMNGGQPIRYVRDGHYLPGYPKIRIEIVWRLQRELAGLGWRRPIAPVIAIGSAKGCWPDPRLLQGLELHSL